MNKDRTNEFGFKKMLNDNHTRLHAVKNRSISIMPHAVYSYVTQTEVYK